MKQVTYSDADLLPKSVLKSVFAESINIKKSKKTNLRIRLIFAAIYYIAIVDVLYLKYDLSKYKAEQDVTFLRLCFLLLAVLIVIIIVYLLPRLDDISLMRSFAKKEIYSYTITALEDNSIDMDIKIIAGKEPKKPNKKILRKELETVDINNVLYYCIFHFTKRRLYFAIITVPKNHFDEAITKEKVEQRIVEKFITKTP